MKIAVVCLASRAGGGLTILRDLHQFASNADTAEQWLFVLSDQDLGQSASHVQLVQAAPNYRGWLSRLRAELTVARRAINRFDPDIVLSLQNVDTPARGRRPLAIYMHQPLPFVDTRFSLLKRAERGLALRQIILGALIRVSIRRARTTFVQTQWIADAVRVACPKVRVERVGYELPESVGEDTPTRSETTCFVYPASAVIYKDHSTLHRAVRLWREQTTEPGKVVITLSRQTFAQLVGGLNDVEAEWYEFVGQVTPTALKEIYARSILVFPSYVETLGLPLYEAQAARCRIVAADTPPTREALSGYPAAHLFTARSPEGMAHAMGEAWKARGLAVDCQRACSPGEASVQSPWQTMLAEFASGMAVDQRVTDHARDVASSPRSSRSRQGPLREVIGL